MIFKKKLITEIFSAIDINDTGRISLEEAKKTLKRLNSCLDKKISNEDLEELFRKYFQKSPTFDGDGHEEKEGEVNQNQSVKYSDFRIAFLNISF